MDNSKTIIVGICILLGLAIIGLCNRYEIPSTYRGIFKIDKLTGQTYSLNVNGIYKWEPIKNK